MVPIGSFRAALDADDFGSPSSSMRSLFRLQAGYSSRAYAATGAAGPVPVPVPAAFGGGGRNMGRYVVPRAITVF